MDAAQLVQLLGRLMPALQHLDPEALAAKSFLVTEQVSPAGPMVLTELMQVNFSCLLTLWGVLWAGLNPQLQLSCLPSPLLSADLV